VTHDCFDTEISRHVWETKYRHRPLDGAPERDIRATWQRVAQALAAVESDPPAWERRFYGALEAFRFIPGGRILAGAGTGRRVTLFNCFVMGLIEDSLDGIFESLKQGASTMQQGGGVGYDFSTLRPAGAQAQASGATASGPVSFMDIWDSMCGTLLSTGNRRGAMMATLRCDHPDIEAFVDAKRDPSRLRHFNLSVQVSDRFIQAVARDEDWPLVFPSERLGRPGGETVVRAWPGYQDPVRCTVLRRVRARALWDQIARAAYDCAEPGVLFVDRINAENNLWYRESISATNPCGEIPLPPYGACNLGSLNLTAWVRAPFTTEAAFDWQALEATVPVAVRMLDNVIDCSRFPLPEQADEARQTRRIGLGITGLADTLAMLGMRYDDEPARTFAAGVMERVAHAAYRASIALAGEKGAFEALDCDRYLSGAFIRRLPDDVREAIADKGIRNSHLLAIAPTGTISLLANNVSSGLEPIFGLSFRRELRAPGGGTRDFEVQDYAYARWRADHPDQTPPPVFVEAQALSPSAHLAMQAALQPFVDQAISKTINIPRDFPFGQFRDIYVQAHALGLKGCTAFRPNPVTGAVLSAGSPDRHCCSLDREAD
jgi:ribonucleoside-diphosphate reductase alpha chain